VSTDAAREALNKAMATVPHVAGVPAWFDEIAAALAEADRLRERVERLEEALREIVECRCTFSLDRLEHTQNAVAHMRKLATEALEPAGADDEPPGFAALADVLAESPPFPDEPAGTQEGTSP
jgi:hypothetical protein